MNVFVSGGSGFLGSHLLRSLASQGATVTAPTRKDCDLRVLADLKKFDKKYDVIFHLAAWTQAGDWCLTHSGEQWLINQQINTNMLAWWQESQISAKFIAVGTSCSYDPSLPMIEDNYLAGQPIQSLYTYAYTKRMLLLGLESINRQYGGQFLYVIPSTLYGPDYHTDGRQMHFIFDLAQKILNASNGGAIPVLWGDGFQKRELIHVQDFILNLWQLIDFNANGIYNLGAGSSHTIKEFAELICKEANYDSKLIEYDLDRYVGAKDKVLVVKKAKDLIENYASRSLDSGISELVGWLRNNSAILVSSDVSPEEGH